MPTAPIIVWFRQDLRLSDHRALKQAASADRPVLPVYILDDESPGDWRPGGASRWWLHHSLKSLADALADKGGTLVLRRGRSDEELARLIEETGAAGLYWTRGYEPHAQELEKKLHREFGERLEVKRFGGALLFEPEAIETGAGEPFKVFTPFWKACLREPEPPEPRPRPGKLDFYAKKIRSDKLDDWDLLPTRPDWSGGLEETWTPGENGAHRRLRDFLNRVEDYGEDRDRPGIAGTSGLSPHLHHGEISPRQVWHTLRRTAAGDRAAAKGVEAYLRELGWREFCYHLLHHWPGIPRQPFRDGFGNFPWRSDPRGLKAWQRGRTGFPIVDAGMRELWHTGWMHNRVRMIVASFLVKHLLIRWQRGEEWFWDTLVDADLANNACGWQWVAGCGADAAPYFRIFNPMLQGKKFDPDGAYVRRWVPELESLPDKHLHEPWSAPAEELKKAGVELGKTYPEPIVDHAAARQRALAALKESKQG